MGDALDGLSRVAGSAEVRREVQTSSRDGPQKNQDESSSTTLSRERILPSFENVKLSIPEPIEKALEEALKKGRFTKDEASLIKNEFYRVCLGTTIYLKNATFFLAEINNNSQKLNIYIPKSGSFGKALWTLHNELKLDSSQQINSSTLTNILARYLESVLNKLNEIKRNEERLTLDEKNFVSNLAGSFGIEADAGILIGELTNTRLTILERTAKVFSQGSIHTEKELIQYFNLIKNGRMKVGLLASNDQFQRFEEKSVKADNDVLLQAKVLTPSHNSDLFFTALGFILAKNESRTTIDRSEAKFLATQAYRINRVDLNYLWKIANKQEIMVEEAQKSVLAASSTESPFNDKYFWEVKFKEEKGNIVYKIYAYDLSNGGAPKLIIEGRSEKEIKIYINENDKRLKQLKRALADAGYQSIYLFEGIYQFFADHKYQLMGVGQGSDEDEANYQEQTKIAQALNDPRDNIQQKTILSYAEQMLPQTKNSQQRKGIFQIAQMLLANFVQNNGLSQDVFVDKSPSLIIKRAEEVYKKLKNHFSEELLGKILDGKTDSLTSSEKNDLEVIRGVLANESNFLNPESSAQGFKLELLYQALSTLESLSGENGDKPFDEISSAFNVASGAFEIQTNDTSFTSSFKVDKNFYLLLQAQSASRKVDTITLDEAIKNSKLIRGNFDLLKRDKSHLLADPWQIV
jgi:hypothetical protein